MMSWEEIGKALDTEAAAEAARKQEQADRLSRERQLHVEAQRAMQQFLEIMKGARESGRSKFAKRFRQMPGQVGAPRLRRVFIR